MGFNRGFVLINFEQVDLVLVLVVLQDIEAQAAGFVVIGAASVAEHGRHELVLEPGLDVDFNNQRNHCNLLDGFGGDFEGDYSSGVLKVVECRA